MGDFKRNVCIVVLLSLIHISIEKIDEQLKKSFVTRASQNIPDDAYLIGMVGRISEQPELLLSVSAAGNSTR